MVALVLHPVENAETEGEIGAPKQALPVFLVHQLSVREGRGHLNGMGQNNFDQKSGRRIAKLSVIIHFLSPSLRFSGTLAFPSLWIANREALRK
jgi:hypothetical protein